MRWDRFSLPLAVFSGIALLWVVSKVRQGTSVKPVTFADHPAIKKTGPSPDELVRWHSRSNGIPVEDQIEPPGP